MRNSHSLLPRVNSQGVRYKLLVHYCCSLSCLVVLRYFTSLGVLQGREGSAELEGRWDQLPNQVQQHLKGLLMNQDELICAVLGVSGCQSLPHCAF